MHSVSLLPDKTDSENRVEIDKVVRAFSTELKSNPKASIYVMGYGTKAIPLPIGSAGGEGGPMRSLLMRVRDLVVLGGAPRTKVVIIGILSPDPKKAGQIDVVCTPVPLPVVVWTENGHQTGFGERAPGDDGGVSGTLDPLKQEIETEVEISYEKFGLKTRLIRGKFTFKGSNDGLEEVSGNLELAKKRLAESLLKGGIQKVTFTLTAQWKYETEKQHVKSSIKASLSAEIPLPGFPRYKLPIEAILLVDQNGKVEPGLGFTVFQFD
jgi:hypothetical protein